jgi:hypothetical protein
MNSGFFRKSVISRENKIVQKFIKEFKSDQKSNELLNKVKNLKNVDQGI